MNETEKVNWLYDKEKIIETVLRFSYAMDVKNWEMLRKCLADEIYVDYSDFRGDPPKFISADEFVNLRVKGLENLKTQHLSTNHLVEINDEKAECVSNFLIHRINSSGESLDMAGHYIHHLQFENNVWLIKQIKQKVLWLRGNKEIHGAFHK